MKFGIFSLKRYFPFGAMLFDAEGEAKAIEEIERELDKEDEQKQTENGSLEKQ